MGGEALVRNGGTDPQARVSLRWGGQLGARLTGALSPSQTADIHVLEWTILAGPAWRQGLAPALDLEIELLGGVLLHHYTILNPYSHDHAGDRIDWAAALPLCLTFRPLSALTVSLRVAGRVNGRSREHVLDGEVIWSRDQFGLEAGGAVGAKF